MNPFTEEHELFRRTVRTFVEKEMAPHAREWDEAGIFPREVFKKFGELGFLGIRADPKYGGSGLDYWYVTAFAEELTASKNAGVNMAILVQCEMATPIINAIGTDEQKEISWPPRITGEKIAALGVSEPGAGCDVANIAHHRAPRRRRLRDQRQQDVDHQRHPRRLHHARGAHRRQGLRRRVTDDFPHRREGLLGGARSSTRSATCRRTPRVLFFEDCRVPRRFLLGEENEGFYHIMTNFQGERLVASIGAVREHEAHGRRSREVRR